MMKRFITLLLIITCFYACKQHTGKPVLLRLKYDKGYRFNVKYRMYIVQGDGKTTLQNDYVRMSFKVDSVMRGPLYQIWGKYDYIRSQGNSMLDMGGYSSDKDESEMNPYERSIHQRFRPLLDSAYHLTVNGDGKIIKPFAFAGGTALPGQLAPIELQNMFITLPKDPVYVGDEWTDNYVITANQAKRSVTYVFRSITPTYTDSVINIGVKGTMSVAGKGSHDFYGEYYFDAKTMQLKNAELNMRTSALASEQAKAVVSIEVQ